VSLLVLIATGAIMLAWTWGKWPDVLVDFGRELYVAWQITEGKVLYRDIAYVQGPLSPYLNALWFTVFGPSVRTLVFANLAILASVLVLLYHQLREISDRLAATTACVVFLVLFAFVQFGTIGNYNYVCPYRHEATHGMLLALAALNCLAAYLRQARPWLVVMAGFCTGLLALTKGEFLMAVAMALAVAFVVACWLKKPSPSRVLRLLMVFMLAAIVPPVASFGMLALAMPAAEALRGVLGSWLPTLHDTFRSSPFVQRGMGTADGWASLKVLWQWTINYTFVFGVTALVSLALRTRGWLRPALSVGLVALLVAKLQATSIHWQDAARPLPLLILLLTAFTAVQIFRRRATPAEGCSLIPRLAFAVFAGVLLGKMALNTRIHHYGFVLAMPAAMLWITTLLSWIPAWIDRRAGFSWAFRGVALAVLISLTHWYLSAAAVRLRSKSVSVADGPNNFLADARGTAVNQVLAKLQELTVPADTLLVLPEGAMLNFLARRSCPVPFVDFVPTEFFYFGEERILSAIQAHPPDFIALVHNDTSEFGFRFFGQDYGQQLFAWIQSHYREVANAGARPFVDEKFGIVLLRKKE